MEQDNLLQEWRAAKETCRKIIEICKMTHLDLGTIEGERVSSPQKQTSRQFMSVYNVVYRLCITKEREENRVMMVYKDYKDLLKSTLLELAPLLQSEKEIYRLGMLRRIWDCYADIQKRLGNMFAYLNRPFFIKDSGIEDLDKTASNILIGTLFMENSVQQYQLIYFKQLDRMRKSRQLLTPSIMKDFVNMMHSIHLKIVRNATNKKMRTIYTQFYGLYQKVSRQFYSRRFRQLKELSPTEYFEEIQRLYEQEQQLAVQCFAVAPQTLYKAEFSQELLVKYKPILLSSSKGLRYILKQGGTDTLRVIAELYLNLTRSLDGFKQQFQAHIFEEMRQFMCQNITLLTVKRSLLNYCSFVERIIRKNQELMEFLEAVSGVGDFSPYYKAGIEQAFQRVNTPVPVEELLAVYADMKFRSELGEGQFEGQVKNIITLFNCAENKDVFLLKYCQRIAKRIFVFSEGALHHHQIFANNLKLNCGIKDTERLQTLLTQYRISNQNQQALDQFMRQCRVQIGLVLKVFGEGTWPTKHILEIPVQLLPPQMQQAHKYLEEYKEEHLSKKVIRVSGLQSKVRWLYYFDPNLGLKAQTCYFDTNCLQAALLYLIYSHRPQPVSVQILSTLIPGAQPRIIKENLDKMSQAVDNILVRQGEGKQTLFLFNLALKTNKKLIPYDQSTHTEQERLFQQNDLGKDRQYVLDANVCKLMKARKILDYKALLGEVVGMVRVFVPQTKDIKSAVDRLIGKEILQRDQKDPQLLRYKD